MPPFAWFEKSRFSEVWGTLWQGPWGPVEVEMEFFFKILDGLEQMLLGTPHMPAFASFEKSRFLGGLGDPSMGSLGAG